jgi:hypothetical protein
MGNTWTKNGGIILDFLHLGYAIRIFEPFVKIDNDSRAIIRQIKPTRSPKDPVYSEWWKLNESYFNAFSESTIPNNAGQEPADD